MTTINRFAKTIALKFFAAVSFVTLFLTKIVLKIFSFVYRIVGIAIMLIAGANAGVDLFNGQMLEAMFGAVAVTVLVALYFGLPALIPMLDNEIGRTKSALRRPMVYKSRVKYTLG